jgi:hypothetical protein
MKLPYSKSTPAGPRFLCYEHGYLPASSFCPSDIANKQRRCRACRKKNNAAREPPKPDEFDGLRRLLDSFKKLARRNNRDEGVLWELDDVVALARAEGHRVSDFNTPRTWCIRPKDAKDAWTPSNCSIVRVAEAGRRKRRRQ